MDAGCEGHRLHRTELLTSEALRKQTKQSGVYFEVAQSSSGLSLEVGEVRARLLINIGYGSLFCHAILVQDHRPTADGLGWCSGIGAT